MKLWHLVVAGLLVWWFFLRAKPAAAGAAAPAQASPGIPAAEAAKVTP